MNGCQNESCNCYPIYGCAPHECYWMKPGGFEKNKIGESTINPVDAWPDNFLAEIDTNAPIEPQISYGLCGIEYCPHCKAGMVERTSREGIALMSAKTIMERIALEAQK